MKVTVDAAALYAVLNALNGPAHYIRELQATRGPIFHDNPITKLMEEYNAAIAQPEPADKPQGERG